MRLRVTVVEALSGMAYSEFVQNMILDPVDMHRTFCRTPPTYFEDIGKHYNVLDDGKAVPIASIKAGNDGLAG